MELGSIFLLLALLILVGLFVARPFFSHRRPQIVSAEEHEFSSIMAERDRLITALQELDFDNTLGKIPAEDYPTQRSTLIQRAAAVLRRIDEFAPQVLPGPDAESRIEAVVASRRADAAQSAPVTAPVVSDDDLEALLASRRAARKEKAAGFCPNCGKPILRSDRFCPGCGASTK